MKKLISIALAVLCVAALFTGCAVGNGFFKRVVRTPVIQDFLFQCGKVGFRLNFGIVFCFFRHRFPLQLQLTLLYIKLFKRIANIVNRILDGKDILRDS